MFEITLSIVAVFSFIIECFSLRWRKYSSVLHLLLVLIYISFLLPPNNFFIITIMLLNLYFVFCLTNENSELKKNQKLNIKYAAGIPLAITFSLIVNKIVTEFAGLEKSVSRLGIEKNPEFILTLIVILILISKQAFYDEKL